MNDLIIWENIKEYKEILFTFYDGIAKISINRPHVHNAFTPLTIEEMIDAMHYKEQPIHPYVFDFLLDIE